MREYKVIYEHTEYDLDPDYGTRVRGADIYEAENAQDAVDQCREDFYGCSLLDIQEVRVWTGSEWSVPLSMWV